MTTRGRGVSVIFGDGAGAAVLSREEDEEYCLRIYTQKGNMPKLACNCTRNGSKMGFGYYSR
jgi:3-oxoacyl-[acyl-carrier-protein] synthase III